MNEAPIGIFDSGVGGLSVLSEIRRLLPHEHLLYYADSGHCPYGGQTAEAITARAFAITDELLQRGAKLIVVACNTATIAAIEQLRATYPSSFVGIEPAIKPAVAVTRSGVVGVLATGAALAGEKFLRLTAQHGQRVQVITQPCPGLVEFVERGDLNSAALKLLLRSYIEPLLAANVDTLVLGCTHYPFLRPAISELFGEAMTILDTGEAVARQTQRLLQREDLLNPAATDGSFAWLSSGDVAQVAPVIERLLRV